MGYGKNATAPQGVLNRAMTRAWNKWRDVHRHDVTMEEAAASTEICRIARGHLGRLVSLRKRQYNHYLFLASRAEVIQRAVRAYLAKMILKMQRLYAQKEASAIKIQNFFRTVLARGRVAILLARQIYMRTCTRASLDIQRIFRGFQGRAKAHALQIARLRNQRAVDIQRTWRGYISRRLAHALRRSVEADALEALLLVLGEAERHFSAHTIQNCFESYKLRIGGLVSTAAVYTAVVETQNYVSALSIQHAFRQHQIRSVLRNVAHQIDCTLVKAVACIQRHARGIVSRNFFIRHGSYNGHAPPPLLYCSERIVDIRDE